MHVETAAPDPALNQVVSGYVSRTADLGDGALRIALPARTQTILEFYFATPHLIELQTSGAREHAPWTVAVGPQTFRRVDLILSGRIDVFTIAFTPTGLHALFGLPMAELTDAAIEADLLLGADGAHDLHDALAAASGLRDRARIADRALLALAARRPPRRDTALVAAAVARIRRSTGSAPIASLIPPDTLSQRQFRRLFEAQVGMSPKLYARVVRLGAALDARRQAPTRSWTGIAHEFGWFDQAHLDKDFHALAGASPSAWPLTPQRERRPFLTIERR